MWSRVVGVVALVVVALVLLVAGSSSHHRLHKPSALAPRHTPRMRARMSPVVAVAEHPPRGWNSYDAYNFQNVDERTFLANVDAVANLLLPYGYDYVSMDYYWYADTNKHVTLDDHGRLQPDPTRFPRGLRYIADYVHQKGLKFGLHIMRGIHAEAVRRNVSILGAPDAVTADLVADAAPRCRWDDNFIGIDADRPGAQAFYDSITAQYAEWGIDLLKFDCVFGADFRQDDIVGLAEGIRHSGRAIALSLSPGRGATVAMARSVVNYTNTFRITDDLWDCWTPARSPWMDDGYSLYTQFAALGNFSVMQAAGGMNGRSWPDPDMLPLGTLFDWKASKPASRPTTLTPDEQTTMMTLWAIARAPLVVGGSATELAKDAVALHVLTNREVLAVQAADTPSAQLWRADPEVVWSTSPVSRKQLITATIAAFNVGDSADLTLSIPFRRVLATAPGLDLKEDITCSARDLWNHQEWGSFSNELSLTVRPHASQLITITCSQ